MKNFRPFAKEFVGRPIYLITLRRKKNFHYLRIMHESIRLKSQAVKSVKNKRQAGNLDKVDI